MDDLCSQGYSCLGASPSVGADEIADKSTPKRRGRGIDELVTEFVGAATLRGAAFERGEPEADVQLSRLGRIRRVLDARGEEGQRALIQLLHHDQPWVQIGAATFTLEIAEHDTLSVLRELSGSGSIAGLTAKLLLDWSEKQRRQPGAKAA